LLFDEDDDKLMTSVSRARRIWESQGYIMQEDRMLLPILFLASLPFGLYTSNNNVDTIDRDFFTPADSITYILPIQSDFAGFGDPHIILAGRKGQVIGGDIYAKGTDNHNAFIAASSGKGKSFFLNYLIGAYYAAGALIRLIDIGGSYKKACKTHHGRYLEFSADSRICLPPFGNVNSSDAEDFAGDIFNIASIINQMIHSTTDVAERDAETTMTLIKHAVRWAWDQEGSDASVDTVHTFFNEFPAHVDREAREEVQDRRKHTDHVQFLAQGLAYNLHDFTSGGMYGKWFNGKSTLNIADDEFVVLELEQLMAQKELFKVVTLQVINHVTADLYLDRLRERIRLILFEEAWKFLMKSDMINNTVGEGYRRARKYRGSFSVVVQSLLDIKHIGNVGDVIMSNSDFKFYLESPDFDKAKEAKIINYDDFVMSLLKTVRSNKPKYSELFIDSPFGLGIGRLVVDPFTYYMNTSDGAEVGQLERLCDGGLDYAEAIDAMIKSTAGGNGKGNGNGNDKNGNGSN
jgi:conjugal transfer ATP-binding protein TraC